MPVGELAVCSVQWLCIAETAGGSWTVLAGSADWSVAEKQPGPGPPGR